MCRNMATVICCRRCGDICSLIVREMSGMEGMLAPVQLLLNLPPLFGLSLPCLRETAIGTLSTASAGYSTPSSPVCLGSLLFTSTSAPICYIPSGFLTLPSYGLFVRRIMVQFPTGTRTASRPAVSPTQRPVQWYRGLSPWE
jgi:hypothetical protein